MKFHEVQVEATGSERVGADFLETLKFSGKFETKFLDKLEEAEIECHVVFKHPWMPKSVVEENAKHYLKRFLQQL